MTSTIKVNNVQNQCGQNIINENSNTITIGASGDTIALASGASQTGFGRTGTVDWQTGDIKTATFTAESGKGYFCNTTSGGFEVDLPAGSAGAIVSVQDYANTFSSNPITIDPNGSEKINGGIAGGIVSLSTAGEGLTLVYIDSTIGWRSVQDNEFSDAASNFISASGGTITNTPTCRIHTFTGPGSFTVSGTAICAANNAVSYLVVAGGGAGGGSYAGGGGGAGGFRELKTPVAPYTASPLDGYPSSPNRIVVSEQSYPIIVGAGGTGIPGTCTSNRGGTGSTSTFSTITSTGGGGGGGGANTTRPINPGAAGGSGGGGMGNCGTAAGSGGAGNTPPVSPPQGQNGGGSSTSAPAYGGGGGGGAGESGETGTNTKYGRGGAGVSTQITGSAVAYAGGGGNGTLAPYPAPGNGGGASPCGTGGAGGGGGSPAATGGDGGDGTTNRGGGGGGGSAQPTPAASGNGGSGVVIIRYKIA
jgi:hypothetical protein